MQIPHTLVVPTPQSGVWNTFWYTYLMAGKTNTKIACGEPWCVHFSRIGVGAVAGLIVALVKYAGTEADVASRIAGTNWLVLFVEASSYAIIPMILGAVGGWISDETKVHKIFWFAITAPIIIAAAISGGTSKAPPALPVGKAGWNFEQLLFISPAYGEEAQAGELSPNITSSNQKQPSLEDAFLRGIKLFLNGGRYQTRYRVVVASIDNGEKAKETADALNKKYHDQLPAPASVGERKLFNPYYPVIINGWINSYEDAKSLRDTIAGMDLGLPDPPYISPEER